MKRLPAYIIGFLVMPLSGYSFSEQQKTTSPLTLTLGAKLHNGGWTGKNKGNIQSDIESESGAGGGISLGLRKGSWFGVFNVQNGTYEFEDEQPVYDPAPISSDELTIKSGFLSLGVGYQFNSYFALQGGIKSHRQSWDDFNREINYIGLGIGFTGFIPLNKNWTLYGTLGLNRMTIEDNNETEIGDGNSTSLELGAAFRISPRSSISFGLKNESLTAEFDSGNEQEHSLGNVYFGYNHAFHL